MTADQDSFYSPQEAAIYDGYVRRTATQDLKFWRNLARQYARCGSVLELGCGTMRVSIALARLGCTVVGVDASASMVERAEAKVAALPEQLRARIDIVHADLRTVEFEKRFDLVCMPLNVLMEFATPADHAAAFAALSRHLAVGGIAALDVPFVEWDALPTTGDMRVYARFRVPGVNTTYVRNISARVSRSEQCVYLTFWTRAASTNNSSPSQHEWTTELRAHVFEPSYLVSLAASAGLTVLKHWGNYDSVDISQVSAPEIQILVMCRANGR